MSANTFSAIRTICLEADTDDEMVTDIADLAGRWVFESTEYDKQLDVLRVIRDMASERLGANDIDWDADGALAAVLNMTTATLGEDD